MDRAQSTLSPEGRRGPDTEPDNPPASDETSAPSEDSEAGSGKAFGSEGHDIEGDHVGAESGGGQRLGGFAAQPILASFIGRRRLRAQEAHDRMELLSKLHQQSEERVAEDRAAAAAVAARLRDWCNEGPLRRKTTPPASPKLASPTFASGRHFGPAQVLSERGAVQLESIGEAGAKVAQRLRETWFSSIPVRSADFQKLREGLTDTAKQFSALSMPDATAPGSDKVTVLTWVNALLQEAGEHPGVDEPFAPGALRGGGAKRRKKGPWLALECVHKPCCYDHAALSSGGEPEKPRAPSSKTSAPQPRFEGPTGGQGGFEQDGDEIRSWGNPCPDVNCDKKLWKADDFSVLMTLSEVLKRIAWQIEMCRRYTVRDIKDSDLKEEKPDARLKLAAQLRQAPRWVRALLATAVRDPQQKKDVVDDQRSMIQLCVDGCAALFLYSYDARDPEGTRYQRQMWQWLNNVLRQRASRAFRKAKFLVFKLDWIIAALGDDWRRQSMWCLAPAPKPGNEEYLPGHTLQWSAYGAGRTSLAAVAEVADGAATYLCADVYGAASVGWMSLIPDARSHLCPRDTELHVCSSLGKHLAAQLAAPSCVVLALGKQDPRVQKRLADDAQLRRPKRWEAAAKEEWKKRLKALTPAPQAKEVKNGIRQLRQSTELVAHYQRTTIEAQVQVMPATSWLDSGAPPAAASNARGLREVVDRWRSRPEPPVVLLLAAHGMGRAEAALDAAAHCLGVQDDQQRELEQSDAAVRETFRKLDRNNDRGISPQELKAGLKDAGILERETLAEVVRSCFDADVNQDDQLSYEEFAAATAPTNLPPVAARFTPLWVSMSALKPSDSAAATLAGGIDRSTLERAVLAQVGLESSDPQTTAAALLELRRRALLLVVDGVDQLPRRIQQKLVTKLRMARASRPVHCRALVALEQSFDTMLDLYRSCNVCGGSRSIGVAFWRRSCPHCDVVWAGLLANKAERQEVGSKLMEPCSLAHYWGVGAPGDNKPHISRRWMDSAVILTARPEWLVRNGLRAADLVGDDGEVWQIVPCGEEAVERYVRQAARRTSAFGQSGDGVQQLCRELAARARIRLALQPLREGPVLLQGDQGSAAASSQLSLLSVPRNAQFAVDAASNSVPGDQKSWLKWACDRLGTQPWLWEVFEGWLHLHVSPEYLRADLPERWAEWEDAANLVTRVACSLFAPTPSTEAQGWLLQAKPQFAPTDGELRRAAEAALRDDAAKPGAVAATVRLMPLRGAGSGRRSLYQHSLHIFLVARGLMTLAPGDPLLQRVLLAGPGSQRQLLYFLADHLAHRKHDTELSTGVVELLRAAALGDKELTDWSQSARSAYPAGALPLPLLQDDLHSLKLGKGKGVLWEVVADVLCRAENIRRDNIDREWLGALHSRAALLASPVIHEIDEEIKLDEQSAELTTSRKAALRVQLEAQKEGFLVRGPPLHGATVACGGRFTLQRTRGGNVALVGDATPFDWQTDWGPGDWDAAPDVTVLSMAAGWDHLVLVLSDGSVRTWGPTRDGQVDDKIQGPRRLDKEQLPVKQAACGADFTVVLLRFGGIRQWGDEGAKQGMEKAILSEQEPGKPCPFAQVAAGARHVVALRVDGVVVCWGSDGPLAGDHGSDQQGGAIAQGGVQGGSKAGLYGCVTGWEASKVREGNGKAVDRWARAVGAGAFHSAALSLTGSQLWIWGVIWSVEKTSYVFQDASKTLYNPGFDVACGYDHTAVLHNNGSVSVWASERAAAVQRGAVSVSGLVRELGRGYASRHIAVRLQSGSLEPETEEDELIKGRSQQAGRVVAWGRPSEGQCQL